MDELGLSLHSSRLIKDTAEMIPVGQRNSVIDRQLRLYQPQSFVEEFNCFRCVEPLLDDEWSTLSKNFTSEVTGNMYYTKFFNKEKGV